MTEKYLENIAREIGQAIADQGHADVAPWLAGFTWWSDVEQGLGRQQALALAEAAFQERKAEREFA